MAVQIGARSPMRLMNCCAMKLLWTMWYEFTWITSRHDAPVMASVRSALSKACAVSSSAPPGSSSRRPSRLGRTFPHGCRRARLGVVEVAQLLSPYPRGREELGSAHERDPIRSRAVLATEYASRS
jgi:hypothetical protein